MRILLLSLILLPSLGVFARGEIVIQGLTGSNTGNEVITGTGFVFSGGISFVTNSAADSRINSIALRFNATNAGTYTLNGANVFLYKMSGTSSIGQFIGSTGTTGGGVSLSTLSIPTSSTLVTFSFNDWDDVATGPSFEANTRYLLGFNLDATGSAGSALNMQMENSPGSGFAAITSGYQVGDGFKRTSGDRLWASTTTSGITATTQDVIFTLNMSAVPEPGTLILGSIAAMVGGGGVLWGRRRRKVAQVESVAGSDCPPVG